VLIHGLATTREIWSAVGPELSRSRRVVTLDVPGFGESAPVGHGFELALVADRIARGLAARGVRGPFDLVGHSLGAAVALTLAVRRPLAVRRLVLVAPAGLATIPWLASRALALGADPVLAIRRALAPLTDVDWGRRSGRPARPDRTRAAAGGGASQLPRVLRRRRGPSLLPPASEGDPDGAGRAARAGRLAGRDIAATYARDRRHETIRR
jgi:pimeloyl-ACP methyl ester carboxylesterase